MSDILLTREQERQVKCLRFDRSLERDFQDSAARERIRRIQVVVVTIVLFFVLAPTPKEVSSTPLMRQVGLATMALTILMLIVVFIPRMRNAAIFALPVWEVFQQLAYGSAVSNPQPFMQTSIQLALAIVIIAAVRSPAKLSLAYAALTLAIRIGGWRMFGLEVADYFGALSFLSFGLIFLVTGSYLTEISDRRSFLIARLLDIERSKTQALLTNVLPAEIAEKLKNTGGVIATSHPAVSVLFADIVNFTPFAAERSASEVVGFLNDLFSRFDALVERSGLEKIKTVGDAYMVAGGLPTYRDDHLEAMADLALEMRGAVATLGAEVRFGLHSGPAIAGVIGTQRFMYDIWGATVNLAARLESTSMPGEIQVSEDVKDALSRTHEFRERGTLELKGVGKTKVFVLVRRVLTPISMG